MKYLITCTLALLMMLSVSAQNGPGIQFENRLHDFGEIKEENKEAGCVFTFKNTGNAPLVIQRVNASCGCTTPDFTKEPVVPGGTGSIKVSFDAVGRPGEFQKTITVYSNDPNNPQVILTIMGNVIPKGGINIEQSYPKNVGGLRFDKTQVSILDAKTGSIRTEKINIINTTSKTIKLSFRNVPTHIRAVASDTELKPGKKGSITIDYLASQAKDYGRREDAFILLLNNSTRQSIQVSAFITEDFSKLTEEQLEKAPKGTLSTTRLNLGSMKKKEQKTQYVTLTNSGKTALLIRKIVPEYDGLKVTPEKTSVPAGQSVRLKVDFNAGSFSGNVVQRATIFTNDPNNSQIRLYVTTNVSN